MLAWTAWAVHGVRGTCGLRRVFPLARVMHATLGPRANLRATQLKGNAMHKIQKTIDIKAPVQRVYDFINQPENLPSVWPNMVSVSNVVAKTGGAHDFDWIFKMAGMHFKGHAKVEEAQSGKLARFRNEGGIPSTFLWRFSGLDGSGTRLTVDVEYTIPTPVIGKIVEALAVKINDRDFDTMLANLKDVMEHGTAGVAVGAHPH